jgi:hypothetical protein
VSLLVWLAAMFSLGLLALGLMVAFVWFCERV